MLKMDTRGTELDIRQSSTELDIRQFSTLKIFVIHDRISFGYRECGSTLKLTLYDKSFELRTLLPGKLPTDKTTETCIKNEVDNLDLDSCVVMQEGDLQEVVFDQVDNHDDQLSNVLRDIKEEPLSAEEEDNEGALAGDDNDPDFVPNNPYKIDNTTSGMKLRNVTLNFGDSETHSDTIKVNDIKKNERLHECAYCKKKFTLKGTLKTHVKNLHPKKFQEFQLQNPSKNTQSKELNTNQENFPQRSKSKLSRYQLMKRKILCSVCGKGFKFRKELLRHMKTHTGEKPFVCHVCGLGFTQKSSLNSHRTVHTGEKPHVCQYCGKAFRMKNNLRHHIRTHTGEKPHKCHICDFACTWSETLQRHIKRHGTGESIPLKTLPDHQTEFTTLDGRTIDGESLTSKDCMSGENPLQCNICGKVFKSRSGLKQHVTKHTKEQTYACKFCGETFRNYGHWASHLKAVHPEEKTYNCWCGLKYKTLEDLRSHKEEVGHQKRVYKCEDCDIVFKWDSAYYQHMNRWHWKKTEKCPHCDKEFYKGVALRYHVQRVHCEERNFICHLCPKRFKLKIQLTSHLKIHEMGDEKNFACEFCPKIFKFSSSLYKHRMTHINGPPPKQEHVCPTCGKILATKSNLNRHLMSHTGEKTHQCNICGKGFIQSSALKSHLNMHNGIKPYSCKMCDKSFTQSSALRAHIRTHTGERLICEICGAGYTQRSKLNMHMKKSHGLEKSNAEYVNVNYESDVNIEEVKLEAIERLKFEDFE